MGDYSRKFKHGEGYPKDLPDQAVPSKVINAFKGFWKSEKGSAFICFDRTCGKLFVDYKIDSQRRTRLNATQARVIIHNGMYALLARENDKFWIITKLHDIPNGQKNRLQWKS